MRPSDPPVENPRSKGIKRGLFLISSKQYAPQPPKEELNIGNVHSTCKYKKLVSEHSSDTRHAHTHTICKE